MKRKTETLFILLLILIGILVTLIKLNSQKSSAINKALIQSKGVDLLDNTKLSKVILTNELNSWSSKPFEEEIEKMIDTNKRINDFSDLPVIGKERVIRNMEQFSFNEIRKYHTKENQFFLKLFLDYHKRTGNHLENFNEMGFGWYNEFDPRLTNDHKLTISSLTEDNFDIPFENPHIDTSFFENWNYHNIDVDFAHLVEAPLPMQISQWTRHSCLPKFIIIGSDQMSLNILIDLMRYHPFLSQVDAKDTGFFNEEYHRGIGWYSSMFPTSTFGCKLYEGKKFVVEASVKYFSSCIAAARIRKIYKSLGEEMPKILIVLGKEPYFTALDGLSKDWTALQKGDSYVDSKNSYMIFPELQKLILTSPEFTQVLMDIRETGNEKNGAKNVFRTKRSLDSKNNNNNNNNNNVRTKEKEKSKIIEENESIKNILKPNTIHEWLLEHLMAMETCIINSEQNQEIYFGKSDTNPQKNKMPSELDPFAEEKENEYAESEYLGYNNKFHEQKNKVVNAPDFKVPLNSKTCFCNLPTNSHATFRFLGGFYDHHVYRWISEFGGENVMISNLYKIKKFPEEELFSITNFLGLPKMAHNPNFRFEKWSDLSEMRLGKGDIDIPHVDEFTLDLAKHIFWFSQQRTKKLF